MKRRHLFEFHEMDLFPSQLRDYCTDILSYLRTYSPVELTKMVEELPAKMVEQVPAKNYKWEVGRAKSVFITRVTYLIGFPID